MRAGAFTAALIFRTVRGDRRNPQARISALILHQQAFTVGDEDFMHTVGKGNGDLNDLAAVSAGAIMRSTDRFCFFAVIKIRTVF